jgi:hypothetical protein
MDTNTDRSDPANPADAAPTEIEAEMDQPGTTGQFQALTAGRIRCLTCYGPLASEEDADVLRAIDLTEAEPSAATDTR